MYFIVIITALNYGQRTLDGTSKKFHYTKDDDYQALRILRMTIDLNYFVDSLFYR